MKKFLALMLTMAMSFCLVACGGDEPAVEEQQQQPVQQEQQQQEPAQQEQQAAQEGEAAAEPLWNYANVQVPSNIVGTTWNLSGGCFDGVELTQEEYEAALEQYGGQCAFYFGEDGVAKMLQGGGELVGTWEYADEDGYVDLPNVNIVEEMVDMIAASRAYEANATVAENVKTMMQSAMNI